MTRQTLKALTFLIVYNSLVSAQIQNEKFNFKFQSPTGWSASSPDCNEVRCKFTPSNPNFPASSFLILAYKLTNETEAEYFQYWLASKSIRPASNAPGSPAPSLVLYDDTLFNDVNYFFIGQQQQNGLIAAYTKSNTHYVLAFMIGGGYSDYQINGGEYLKVLAGLDFFQLNKIPTVLSKTTASSLKEAQRSWISEGVDLLGRASKYQVFIR